MRTKEELPECPVATAVSLIGGKWKLVLLRNLKERPWRFNELQRSIDGISQKMCIRDSAKAVPQRAGDLARTGGGTHQRKARQIDADALGAGALADHDIQRIGM